jgi:hypothetical protein
MALVDSEVDMTGNGSGTKAAVEFLAVDVRAIIVAAGMIGSSAYQTYFDWSK